MTVRRLTPNAELVLQPAEIKIKSNGFTGDVEYYGRRRGTRNATKEEPDFVAAVAEAGMEDRHTLLLDGSGDDGATLGFTCPAASNELQYALVQAEDNSLRFCYPQQDANRSKGNRSTTMEAHYEI